MMQNKMQSCINQQQAAMGSVLAGAQRNTAGFVERYSEKKISRIILAGAGSSFHSMNMARPFCHEVMKVPVFAATPAQLDWLNGDYAADTLVIAASQSGTSSNTLSLVQRLKKQGFDVSAITQDSASYIAKAVDCHVLLDIPAEPAGPKTMGVLGTILTTQMLLAQLALAKGRMPLSAYEGFLADIRRACSYLSENIEMAKSWLEKNKGDLSGIQSIAVAAKGDNSAIAGEAALKMVETIRISVTSYEFEEIVHGPLNCFQKGMALFYLGTLCEDEKRPGALCSICEEMGGRAYRFLQDESAAYAKGNALYMRSVANPLLAAYSLLIPAQVISGFLPPLLGIDLDIQHHSPWLDVLCGHLS